VFSKFAFKISWSLVSWFFFFITVFGIQQITRWPIVTYSDWSGGKSFVDLRSVLHSAECSVTLGWAIYNPDEWGDCGYIYGSTLIQLLRWLNLNPDSTSTIGWGFIFFYSALSAFIISSLRNLSGPQIFWCVIILVSPGPMLLLERANIDALLLILLVIAAFFLDKRHESFSLGLIALTALFKFYTLPLMYLISFFSWGKKKIILPLALSLFVTVLILRDLIQIKGDFPSNVLGSFGNQIPALYLNYVGIPFPRFYKELIGYVLLLFVGLLVSFFFKKQIISFVDSINLKHSMSFRLYLQVLLFITFLVCFFSGVNYDYRLPFILIPSLLFLGTSNLQRKQIWSIIALLAIVSWSSYNAGFLQPVGDGVLIVLVVTLIQVFFLLMKRIAGSIRLPNK
jgi:hypothetical protein